MEKKSRLPGIAYYSINDPLDKRSWSGATYYLGKSLQKNVGEIHFLGPVKIPWLLDKVCRAMQKFTRFFFKTEWIPKYSLVKNIYAARMLKKKMKGHQYDFLVAPAAASELAYLNTSLPVIYFGDATYKIYRENYKKEFKDLNSFSGWEGNHLEKRALKKSTLIIMTSHWATNSAVTDYGMARGKTEVIQMGANIDYAPAYESIFKKQENKVLTLLFLSVDWDRKGGPIAFDTLSRIHDAGIKVKLIICGCTPPAAFMHPGMEVTPFLNKNEPGDFQRFIEILSEAHFLLLPTRADCTPVVNSESNAYGIPVITTDVGGVSEAVKDGVNGYCLPMDAGGAEYASLIIDLFSDKEKYHRLIESSRKRYDEVLNWDKFAENFCRIVQKHGLFDFKNQDISGK